MARINVEQSALADPRFRHLGELLRCPKRFAAHAGRGIMEHVWNHLTENWSEDAGPAAYCVAATTLRRLFDGASFGPRLAFDMVSAGLAEETEFGFRIRGTLGRIEWLNRRRVAARDNGKMGGRKPNSVNPPSPALSPSLSPPQEQLLLSDPPKAAESDSLARVKPRNGKKPDPELVRTFGLFYEDYPRHEGRDAALKAWIKLAPDKAVMRAIADDMDARLDDGRWQPDDPERAKYIPLPASYLNGRRWEDGRIS